MDDTEPIPVQQPPVGTVRRRRRGGSVLTAVLALLVVVLAVTTAAGFARAAQASTDADAARAQAVVLQHRLAAQATELAAAKRCLAVFDAARDQQSTALADGAAAVEDLQGVLGAATRFDLGRVGSLIGGATGSIRAATAALTKADAAVPADC